ncbi:hypothetical protein H072_5048 [Dactylellina haptotyla CBS 200.50]|uniref:Uncharacterized protein n=1 Tax=Dactylellina haptotyla (strain CBS 200.50) TaxID=1284197 RepID=S8BNK3_DACHA|nr:hypothetical protein H072_5048 [Dactylellina haptotyla CBS 200.50]
MPITWTHENVSRLFLVTLAVHHIHMDYKQIAAAFGGDASPRAIEEKMKKLRKEAREFGDGSIDFLVNRGRKDGSGGGKSGTNGKGGVGKSGRNGKGRARPVKYENGIIKWEYDNCEDDSEGESNLSPRGYGDLMECYLMKKENKVEEEVGVGQVGESAPLGTNPHPYYMVDPTLSAKGYGHGEYEAGEHDQQSQMESEAGDIGSVMDPMLTNGLSNMTFQAASTPVVDGLQDERQVTIMAWEQNEDLRDLNDEFRSTNSPQLMEIESEPLSQLEDHETNSMQESGNEFAEVSEVTQEIDIIENENGASSDV